MLQETMIQRTIDDVVTPSPKTEEFTSLVDEVVDALEEQGSMYAFFDYGTETTTCEDKLELWEDARMKERMKSRGLSASGMIKSILFKYEKGGEERYVIACTLAGHQIDTNKLWFEFAGDDFTMKDIDVLSITGRKKGELGPLLVVDKLAKIDGIYFTVELLREAYKHPKRLYDIPITKQKSLFVSPTDLFSVLQGRSDKYVWSYDPREEQLEQQEMVQEARPEEKDVPWYVVDDWKKVKRIDCEDEPKWCFLDTEILYGGKKMIIKQPRKSEGWRKDRGKETGCLSTLIDSGGKYIERSDGRKHRVLLPLDYEIFEHRYEQHLFGKSSHAWLAKSA